MEIYKQITKDIDVVSIASFQELKFNFWKDDNKEYLESEIKADIRKKYEDNNEMTIGLVKGLFYVCNGAEPDLIIERLGLKDTIGIDVETLLKVYKWIWGQEDCNYPKQKGRWLSMDGLLEEYGIDKESLVSHE